MSRTAMNILTVILIIALAIWAIYTYKACQEQKKPVVEDTTDIYDNNTEDTSDTLDDMSDLYEDTSEDDTVGDNSDTDPDTTDDISDTGDDADDTDDTDSSDTGTSDTATSDVGDFLIIVGAYLSRESAEKVVNRLNKLGYNAERRVFLSSDYHSVIVGNYEDLNEAYRVTKKIKDAGYPDAYAHKKRMPKKKG